LHDEISQYSAQTARSMVEEPNIFTSHVEIHKSPLHYVPFTANKNKQLL